MDTSTITSASKIQMDYMKLLVTQLQNQNPLEPMDNSQMASQLTQFSQLQQLESMKTSFSDVLTTANRSYANSLLGKTVTFYSENKMTGELERKAGTVCLVLNDDGNGESLLGVTVGQGEEMSEYMVSPNAVVSVKN